MVADTSIFSPVIIEVYILSPRFNVKCSKVKFS